MTEGVCYLSILQNKNVTCYDQMYLSRVMRKPAFCICKNRDADQLPVIAKLISAFVFATLIAQSLFFLNMKFQTSSHLVWLYSLVCVGPGRKPRGPVFSQRGSFIQNQGVPCRQVLVVNYFLGSKIHSPKVLSGHIEIPKL